MYTKAQDCRNSNVLNGISLNIQRKCKKPENQSIWFDELKLEMNFFSAIPRLVHEISKFDKCIYYLKRTGWKT